MLENFLRGLAVMGIHGIFLRELTATGILPRAGLAATENYFFLIFLVAGTGYHGKPARGNRTRPDPTPDLT